MPAETLPTVKVKPSHESQGAYVEINESDFDPKVHELFEADAPKRGRPKKESAADAAE